jgi:hypothetical protein
VNTLRARKGPRTLLGLVAATGLLAALAMPVIGASVTPEFSSVTANQECDEFQGDGQTWTTLKVDPNPDGAGPFVYTEGPLTVTITNAVDDKSFDWTSNIGVDAVFVKAGAGGSNLYRYDPPAESTGDTGLVSPGDSGNGISHISFCYDLNDATPTPTPTASPTLPATPPPTPSPTVNEGELGGTPTPAPSQGTVPDTAMGQFDQVPATVLSLVLLGALAAMIYVRLARQR